MSKGLLEGVKVLDLTRVLAGPYCGMMLADMGAEVIKIELPGRGDDARKNGPFVKGESAYYMNLNRNKRGFQIPVAQWLRGRLRPLMEDLFSAGSIEAQGFFNHAVLRRMMDDHFSGRKDLRVPLWTLMVFQLWWRNNAK